MTSTMDLNVECTEAQEFWQEQDRLQREIDHRNDEIEELRARARKFWNIRSARFHEHFTGTQASPTPPEIDVVAGEGGAY
jgi:hypothetical protein